MITKNIKKAVIAVAFVFAVMFTSGVSDNLLDTALTAQANAGCIGGQSSGGGC